MTARGVAFFEAGRAVAGWYHSRSPARAGVEPASAKDRLFFAVAGIAAEARFRGIAIREMATEAPTRWADMLAQAAIAEPDEGRRAALVDVTHAEVRTMLNAPKIWAAVQAVAGALLARRTLEPDEVRTIIERTTATRRLHLS